MYVRPKEIEDGNHGARVIVIAVLVMLEGAFVCDRNHLSIHGIRERESVLGEPA